MRTIPLPFIAPVRGVTHYPDTVSGVRVHDPVTVEREPDNPFDSHACRVKVNGETVGYLPRELSRRLTSRSEGAWKGSVHEVLVGDIGIGLRIQVVEGAEPTSGHLTPTSDSTLPDARLGDQAEGLNQAATETIAGRDVYSTSGRKLGTFDGQDEKGIWVHTPAGQRVAYPAHLVSVAADNALATAGQHS